MTQPLKIVFAGTPEFGLPCLNALSKENISIQAIYTQPDRPAGRGRSLQYSPIKDWGVKHNIPVYQPQNFKTTEAISTLKELSPDLMIVIAYGLILPKVVLEIPKYGCINVHASILPRWRGASPIQHAILHGDSQTGITIMQMDVGMDTGDYYEIEKIAINQNDNAKTLHDKLANLAVKPLINTIQNFIFNKKMVATKQDDSKATYAGKITKENAAIDWQKAAIDIEYQVRAYNPWPLAYTNINNFRFQILEAHALKHNTNAPPGVILDISKEGIKVSTGRDILLITTLKFPGKNAISSADYMNYNNKMIQIGSTLI